MVISIVILWYHPVLWLITLLWLLTLSNQVEVIWSPILDLVLKLVSNNVRTDGTDSVGGIDHDLSNQVPSGFKKC